MSERSFFAELRRRNVWRAAAFYAAGAWLVVQVAGLVLPAYRAEDWVLRWIISALVVGFPFWLLFAWFYEITPEGIRRESEIGPHEPIDAHTGKRMDRWIIAILSLAVVLLLTNQFVVRKEPAATAAPQATVLPAIPEVAADPSIAVLPFVNMSSDKEQEYFSDGISEELLNLLAKVPKLRVIARTSSFSFKGTNTPIPEIARQLQVATVLEGSVRKSSDKVRITAQLVRASDSSQLWSETYDRELHDIFKVQDEIAAAVVAQLKIKLLGTVPTAKPVDPKVYPMILQAQALLDRQDKAGRDEAIGIYRQALAIDPGEARAWSGLARAYLNQVVFSEVPVAEGARLASEAANKALASDPGNAHALALLARVAGEFQRDLPAAARYFERALEAEPGHLTALNGAAIMLGTLGRPDEARALCEYRLEKDPASATAHNNLSIWQYYTRRWDDAIDSLRNAIRLSPGFPGAHAAIAAALLVGKRDAAGAMKECEAEQHEASRDACMVMALHALGRASASEGAFEAFAAKYPDQPALIGSVRAYQGRADDAFGWLEKAVSLGDPAIYTLQMDPVLDSLHDDPRWLPFLRKAGYAPEQLAKIEFKVTLPE